MNDDPPVTALAASAANSDKRAWDTLVERYTPLIGSICSRHQLAGADAEDICQTVWLQLLTHLGEIRDPAALAGWIATTTRRECGRTLRAPKGPAARHLLDAETIADQQTPMAEEELLAAERHAALLQALTRLPRCCQQLITLLTADPPVPYAQISAEMGIPVGSIGPRRSRCLEKLRRDPAIAALINPESAGAGYQLPRQPHSVTTITH